jgi:predicted CoA-binding protein
MSNVPGPVADFLTQKRIAVAGVSRGTQSAANPVYRKLRECGYEVFPVNPHAAQVEGATCYPDLASIPGGVGAVMVATAPAASLLVVREALERGIGQVWFHRSFGSGSVSPEAVAECELRGVRPIVGGCPLMYCAPVDFGHRCLRAILRWRGRVPG